MTGFLLRFLPSLPLPHANAVWCINSRVLMNAIPKREHEHIAAELVGIWNQPTKEQAVTELAAFKGKYRERYPEAVRSLCEDEEHLLTFYAFPQAMHRHIRSTNAIESFFRNVRRRTDQIDTLYFGNQLSLDCLARDARDSFVKDCCLVIGLRRKAGGKVCKQPADNGWLGRAFWFSCWPATLVSGSPALLHFSFRLLPLFPLPFWSFVTRLPLPFYSRLFTQLSGWSLLHLLQKQFQADEK